MCTLIIWLVRKLLLCRVVSCTINCCKPTRRPLRRPIVRKKSENIDPKHTYKTLSKQMNTFKIMESEKDDKGDMNNNIFFFLCFFSYVHFIAKLVLQAMLHLMHIIIFFLWCFFLMCQIIELLLWVLPHIMHQFFSSCSHVFFWCPNSPPNYSCQHFHISCIQIFFCSYVLF